MTPFRYRVVRSFATFGLHRKAKRLGEAASETHLLREAEEVLGYLTWKNAENVENLSSEYWSLRELLEKRSEINGDLNDVDQKIKDFQLKRQGAMADVSTKGEGNRMKRAELMKKVEQLSRKRDGIVRDAKEVRHRHAGQKKKLQVLKAAGNEDGEEAKAARQSIARQTENFEKLRAERQQVAEEINLIEAKLAEINALLESETSDLRGEASELSSQIGALNRKSTDLRAELGQVDKQRDALYRKVGNYLTRYYSTDSDCKTVTKGQAALVRKILALRNSIILNNKLAEFGERRTGNSS